MAGWLRPLRSAPVPGRSPPLLFRHRSVFHSSLIPRCYGRDGRTPLTQKFNFGFRVQQRFRVFAGGVILATQHPRQFRDALLPAQQVNL